MENQGPVNKFYRSRTQRVLGGVCGGLSEHFHIDPLWMRILFILLILFAGIIIVVYIVLWIIIPLRPLSLGSGEQDNRPPTT